MLRNILSPLFFILIFTQLGQSQSDRIYNYSLSDNYLDLIGSTAIYFGGSAIFNSIESKTDLSTLKVENLWKIDRSAVYNMSLPANKWSDRTVIASMAFPLAAILSQSKGNNEGSGIALMALQGILLEKGLNNIVKSIVQRPRPFNYRLDGTTSRTLTKSFYSGHTSGAAFFSYFGASVFSQTNPDSSIKPVVWGTAIALPAITGILRYKAGKHFPTDVIVGYAVGAAIGLLIPKLYQIN